MATSPLAMVALGLSARTVVRRVPLSELVARHELRLARLALVAMTAFLLGAVTWLADAAPRPRAVPADLFHVGAIDVVATVVMGVALLCAFQATMRGLDAARRRS